MKIAEFLGDRDYGDETSHIEEFVRDAGPSDILLPVEHLSVSQVQMLNRCPEQYRQRYVLGKKERPGAALVIGSAFHDTIEADFRHFIDYSGLLDEKDLKDVYHANFDAKLEEAGGVNEVSWDEKAKPDTVRLHGEQVTLLYHDRVSPTMTPMAVESKFEISVPGVPVPIHGLIDFIGDTDSKNETYVKRLVDYKTSARAQRTLKPEWILQGRTYQYAEQGGGVEWHVVVKGAKPNVITPTDAPDLFQIEQPGTAQYIERTYQQAAKLISFYWQAFGADEPWPMSGFTHPWACGFCAWKSTCASWRLS